MPRQNRVTPFSTLIATPARGRWLGNRGCLHDDAGRIRRLYQTRRWIICQLEFKGFHRELMQPGRWTELFFLDEATAFAAGHRPCAYCQSGSYEAFRALWAQANSNLATGPKPGADELDTYLHAERLDPRRQRLTYRATLAELPDGAFVVHQAAACLVRGGHLWPWAPGGYESSFHLPGEQAVEVLTPQSVVRTIAAGFAVQIDDSAGQMNDQPHRT